MGLATPLSAEPKRARERRLLPRYLFPLSRLLEAWWNGERLRLVHAPAHENINARALCLCVEGGPQPPVGGLVDIRFPAAARCASTYVHCRGRVDRYDAPNRLVVLFEKVRRVKDE